MKVEAKAKTRTKGKVKAKVVDLKSNERFMRQIDILDISKCKIPICIIGAGATGSFVALALAKMGLSNIRVFDKDTIEEHNLPNQFFPTDSIGKNKTTALKELVEQFTDVKIMAAPVHYEKQPLKGIVISALDSMSGRKLIYENALKSGDVKLLIDPRSGPEMFQLLTVDMSLEDERKEYVKTLYSDSEADDFPCTARAIIYNVLLLSASICHQVKSYLMHQEYKRDMVLDIRSSFFMVK